MRFTLTSATGGSFLTKAVAAFSYSGASRLPTKRMCQTYSNQKQRKRNSKHTMATPWCIEFSK